MPIISDIGSIGNLLLNLVKTLIENPLYLVLLLIILLFFPLNIIDLVLFILVNIFIVIINVLFWIIIIPVNILIAVLEIVINAIITIIFLPFNLILDLLGADPITPPTSNLPNISYSTIPYITINFFNDSDTIIGFIVSALGLSFPIWKMNIVEISKMIKINGV